MFGLFKAFIVVMGFTTLVFVLARPVFCRFMDARDFALRRNVWLALTTAAFLIPNYWLYVLVAAVIVIFAVTRDSNPSALYMLLLIAIPPLGRDIPTFGLVNQVFFLEHLRFLSIVLLTPLLLGASRLGSIRASRGSGVDRRSALLPADVLIVAYMLLQILLSMPYESATATARRMVLLGTDMWLPYFVVSRTCRSRESIQEVMAAFTLADRKSVV